MVSIPTPTILPNTLFCAGWTTVDILENITSTETKCYYIATKMVGRSEVLRKDKSKKRKQKYFEVGDETIK